MGAASMQDMQRLQQQLQAQAQFQSQQQANGGAGASSAQLMGVPQNNAMQSQQFPGQFSSSVSQPGRGGAMGNTALAMMQQNQQPNQPGQANVAGGNNMAGMQQGSGNMASMFGSFGSVNQAMIQGGNQGSSMDASNNSSARLMAMAGMNMNQMGQNNPSQRSGSMVGMDSSSTMQNMQAIMQQQAAAQQKQPMANAMGLNAQGQQQQAQGQNPQQMFNQGGAAAGAGSQSMNMMRGMDGNSSNQMNPQQQLMIQQQLASLQQRMQGQQANNMNPSAAVGGMNNQLQPQGSSQNLLQQRQQQLLQQMQNQRAGGNMLNQQMTQGVNQQGQDMNANNNMNMMQRMMQQQQGNNASMSSLPSIGQGSNMNNLQQQQQQNAVLGAFALGPLTDQQLRLRQQNILRGSADAASMSADAAQAAQSQQQSGGSDNRSTSGGNGGDNYSMSGGGAGMDGSGGQSGSGNQGNAAGIGGNLDTSTHSNSSNRQQGSNRSVTGATTSAQQKSFLDGNFAGGWQSNADLPDRRKVIFSILEVIKQMRPNTNTTSTKLPHMAKSLEEHLYRSAQTKEEYLDPKTLKQRLQTIAQGLDLHRPPRPAGSQGNSMNPQQQGQDPNMMMGNNNNMGNSSNIVDPWEGSQNGDQDSGMMGGQNWGNNNGMGGSDMNNSSNPLQDDSMVAAQQRGSFMAQQASFGNQGEQNGQMMPDDFSQMGSVGGGAATGGNMINPEYPNTPKYQDAEAAQKRKVILQQQQRLLLLRHASKCRAGPACTTKFCSQMVTLWKHMKTCRDKNCKTSHCLSSRCVLNHYRICKSQGKTATCEVCGPVMAKIKHGREDDSGDPLAQSQAQQQQQNQQQQDQQQQQMGQQQPDANNMSALAARMMANQRGQAAGMQNQSQGQGGFMGGNGNDQMNSMNPMGDMSQMQGNQMAGMMGPGGNQLSSPGMAGGNDMEQNQLQQLQQHQMKMQAQLEALKELQRQQQQLLEQQGRLQEQSQMIQDMNSPQAQQLRQQQMLLDQLQKRCHQQQLRLQQEIQMQSETGMMGQQLQQPNAPSSSLPDTANNSSMPSMASVNPMGRQESVASASDPGMDGSSASRKKRRGSGKEAPSRRGSDVGKRATGKGKALQKQLQDSRAEGNALGLNLHIDAFAKKRALVQSNSRERGQDKNELLPLAGETSSLVSYMGKDEIIAHLDSLNKNIRLSSRTVTHKCMPVLQALIDDQFGWVFHDAVDPVALGLPDYFEVVKNPMHLALVKKKLENAIYPDMELFARDVRVVFENAILYNGDTSEVGELAQSMLVKFDQLFRELVQGVESSQQNLESRGEACSLCGNQTRRYEPNVLHCRGKCGMQRIKRGATYYTERTKANHWCQACYEGLSPEETLVLDDGTEIKKNDLYDVKNDALPEEAWVTCEECQCWVHQACALFNGRANRSNAKYTCPNCVLKRGDTVGFPVSKQKFMKTAEDIAKCKMSDAIEEGVKNALEKAYTEKAKEQGVSVEEIDRAEGLFVRVLSNVEKTQQVGEEMVLRYGNDGCPSEFPVRSKCIALFQKIHGIDTMLFAMYVYEYDHNCPAPNRRRVYISYIDSVQYFEPKAYRTIVYQAILMEYLRYVKDRGFHTAHIWSCPPTPGDDYIFFVHPSHQLVPREDMLRSWYHKMLDKAKTEGVVIRTTTLYDEYFNKDTISPEFRHREDPLCLPYFEGDYIPGEIETIVKQLNEKGVQRSPDSDDVMKRLKNNIGKMKDNFIVAHLRNRRFAAAVERGEDVSAWLEDSDEELVRSKRAKISGKEARPTLSPFDSASGAGSGGSSADKPELPAGGPMKSEASSTDTKKRSLSEIEPAISSHMAKLDRRSTVVKDTSEVDAVVESDLFESRQQFLNHCQTTHCQFDELRRAKHSTLLVLYQIHNPESPVAGGDIRERNQRVRKQQQLMDDRRRQAQNELYQTGGES